MRLSIFLLLVLGIAVGCGKKEENQTITTNPPAAPGTSSPTTSNGLKWTNEEINSAADRCAARGSSSYSVSQWRKFCLCSYKEAAKRWSREEFNQYFEQNYEELSNDRVIDACFSQAGMSS